MKERLSIDITWKTIGRLVAVAVAFWTVLKLQNLIFYLLFALLFAVALSPLISWFEGRGMRRNSALALVIVLIVGAVFSLVAVTVGSLATSVVDFFNNLPEYLDKLKQYDFLKQHIPRIENAISDINFNAVIQQGLNQSSTLISGASRVFEAGLFTFFLTIYMLLEKDYLRRIFKRLVPKSWAHRSGDIETKFVSVVGGYIRGQLLTSTLVGLTSYIFFRMFGVPNASALAIIAGLTDIIPVIGGLLGIIPAAVISLTVSPLTAVMVILLMQSYSTLSNYLIRPRIFGSSLSMSPFIITVATVAGLMLFGIPGIILALPVAATVGFILTEYYNVPILERS